MKKTINTVLVEGRVYNHNLQKRVVQRKESPNFGKSFIMGDVFIAVDDDGLNVIPVHFSYVPEEGKRAATYQFLEGIIDSEGSTWVAGGKENALYVGVTGSVAVNDFYVEDDQNPGKERLVSAKRIDAGFIKQLYGEQQTTSNTFTTDMLIYKVEHKPEQVNEYGEVFPEYAVVKGYVFDFKGAVLPVDFRVETPQGIQYFLLQDAQGEPTFRKIWGHFDSKTVKREIKEESAFGEASVRTVNVTNKKWVIDGTASMPYAFGDPAILTPEEVDKKVQERNVYLAGVKQRSDEYKASKNALIQPTTRLTDNIVKDSTKYVF